MLPRLYPELRRRQLAVVRALRELGLVSEWDRVDRASTVAELRAGAIDALQAFAAVQRFAQYLQLDAHGYVARRLDDAHDAFRELTSELAHEPPEEDEHVA